MKTLRTLLVLCALVLSASLSATPRVNELEGQVQALQKQITQLETDLDNLLQKPPGPEDQDLHEAQVLSLQGLIERQQEELRSANTQLKKERQKKSNIELIGHAVHNKNVNLLDGIDDPQLREDLKIVINAYFEQTDKKDDLIDWCVCPNASVTQRFLLLSRMARDIESNYEKTKPLICMSFGSGRLLQEYLLHKLLNHLGFNAITWVLIDPSHAEEFLEYFLIASNFAKNLNIKGMGGSFGPIPLEKRLGIMKRSGETKLDFIPLTENVRKENMSTVLSFRNIGDYMKAIETNNSMKADVVMLVDSRDMAKPYQSFETKNYNFKNILQFSLTSNEIEPTTYVIFDPYSEDFRISTSEKKEAFQRNAIAQIFKQEGLSTKERFEKLIPHFEPLKTGKFIFYAGYNMSVQFYSALPRVLSQQQRPGPVVYTLNQNIIEKIDLDSDLLSFALKKRTKKEGAGLKVFTPAEFRQFISD